MVQVRVFHDVVLSSACSVQGLSSSRRQGRATHPLEGLDVHVQLLCDFLGVGLPLHLSPRHLVQQSLGRAAPHAWRSYGGQAHAISSPHLADLDVELSHVTRHRQQQPVPG